MEKRNTRWTHDETKAFLIFYAARKSEFLMPRKRREAFKHIVEDLISAGFDSKTAQHCEVKMHTLLRAYKCAKDNAGATGASPCMPPFYEEMNDIFGDKAVHTKSEAFCVGAVTIENDASSSQPTSPDTPSTSTAFIFPPTNAQADPTSSGPTPASAALNVAAPKSVPTPASAALNVAALKSVPTPASGALDVQAPKNRRALSKAELYKIRLDQRERELAANDDRFQKSQALKLRALKEKQDRFEKKTKMFEEFRKNKNTN